MRKFQREIAEQQRKEENKKSTQNGKTKPPSTPKTTVDNWADAKATAATISFFTIIGFYIYTYGYELKEWITGFILAIVGCIIAYKIFKVVVYLELIGLVIYIVSRFIN